MPSVNSSSVPNVFDSSTVTTPSLPTLSMASAMTSPIDGSAAEIVATLAMSDLSSTSLAFDTPSLVIVGAPHFLSRTTLRPLGPSVTLTALASLSTPASSARRASSSNFSSLAIGSALHHGEDVAAGQDQQVLAVDRDLRTAVLRVQDGLADADVE